MPLFVLCLLLALSVIVFAVKNLILLMRKQTPIFILLLTIYLISLLDNSFYIILLDRSVEDSESSTPLASKIPCATCARTWGDLISSHCHGSAGGWTRLSPTSDAVQVAQFFSLTLCAS